MPSRRYARYYEVRRAATTASESLDAYWQASVDPDGNPRKPAEERERRLENCKTELAFLRRLAPGRILDVGCGVGYLLSALDPAWEKHGTEVSPFAAELARAHARVHLGPLEAAAYPEAHFDVVVLYHVIEHMQEPVLALREAYRILKPGGHMLVGTPDFDGACARRFRENFRMLHDVTHTSLFSSESLRRLLLDTGLVVEHVDYPYFDSPHFTLDNLKALFDTGRISPPFYGNVVTFYCRRPERSATLEGMTLGARALTALLEADAAAVERARRLLDERDGSGGTLWLAGEEAEHHAATFVRAGYRALPLASADALPAEARPGDVLLVATAYEPARSLLSAAKQHGLFVVVACRADREYPADVTLDVDSASPDARRVALRGLLDGLTLAAR